MIMEMLSGFVWEDSSTLYDRHGSRCTWTIFLLLMELMVDGVTRHPGLQQPTNPRHLSRTFCQVQPCPRTAESQKPSLDPY
ncbi:hypothetical protein ALP06_200321 [Pseudomonas coronafaciens pv. atropurpurea]|nr:hypothetical protein ALP06_200321 [Pseudomonas coronafaciens pv. atropurpurea]